MAVKIQLLFLDNSSVEFNEPPGFRLPDFVHGFRSLGFILANNAYIPAHIIKAVLRIDDTQPAEFVIKPAPNAPSTGTLQ